MTPDFASLLSVLLIQAGLSLLFLLIGWRLGRESVSQPMFAFPLWQKNTPEASEQADPWTEAAQGLSTGQTHVDIF